MTSTPAGCVVAGTAEEEQRAIERVLARAGDRPAVAFRTYDRPALVLGRGQSPDNALLARAAAAGLDVTRRHSGGGAVIAGRWMMSQFLVLPPDHPLAARSLADSFEHVGRAWQAALAGLGVPSRMVPPEGQRERTARFRRSDVGWVCFAGLSYGELTSSSDAKLLGLAQVRRRTGIAIVAGLLLARPPWETLVQVWHGHPDPTLAARLATLTATCADLGGGDWTGRAGDIAGAVLREMADLDAEIVVG